jgi:hypothetical protein
MPKGGLRKKRMLIELDHNAPKDLFSIGDGLQWYSC